MLDQLLDEITSSQAPADMTTKIVAIDGGGGAGKSTLASRLSVALGGIYIIHIDDFIDGPNPNIDWWMRAYDQVVIPLSRNQAAHYQRYNWDVKALAEWLDAGPGGIIILEGVTSLRTEFRPYIAYGIWIETPPDTRMARGIARGNEDEAQWHKYLQSDRLYFDRDRPDLAAQTTIDGTGEYAQ
jgi:uridine kinase